MVSCFSSGRRCSLTQQTVLTDVSGPFGSNHLFFMLVPITNWFSRKLRDVKESNCEGLVRAVVMIEFRTAGLLLLQELDD